MEERPNYLISFDFDGTCFNTFEKSPNGIGVNEAYDKAVLNIFGERGKDIYKNQLNGLKNRAPGELVESLLALDKEDILIDQVIRFFNGNISRLLALLPDNKKKNLDFSNSKMSETITELLITEKLSFLSNEVGKELTDGQVWPRPCRGFPDFYKSIDEINRQGEVKIDTVIISSGHTEFIKKTFNTFNLKMPDYMVTDDDLREIKNVSVNRKTKPNPYPFALVHNQWLKNNGYNFRDKTKIVYFGDDPKKDGGMAKNCMIPFGLFSIESPIVYDLSNKRFSFNDWRMVKDILINRKEILVRGGSMLQVFLENE